MTYFGEYDEAGPSEIQSRVAAILMPLVDEEKRIELQSASWRQQYDYFSENFRSLSDLAFERA